MKMGVRNLLRFSSLFLAILFISGARRQSFEDNGNLSLSAFIEDVLFKKYAPEAQWGVYIERLDNNQVIYERNAHSLFQPASNRKILSTSAALAYLTPGFKYQTDIYLKGEVKPNGSFEGDLIIKASGDPSLHPFFDDRRSPVYPFNYWAKEISKKGINYIKGNIVIDESVFERYDFIPEGWSWEQLKDNYASPTSAFALNENCITVTISPDKTVGAPLILSSLPDIPSQNILNLAKTSSKPALSSINFVKNISDGKILLTGELGINLPPQINRIPMTDPDHQVAEAFKIILEKEGVNHFGEIKIVSNEKEIDYKDANLIYSHISPPLEKLIRFTLLESNNFFAEQIFKTVSAKVWNRGSYENSCKLEKQLWTKWGLDLRENVPADGCGLSRANLVSPYFITQVLKKMREKHPDWGFENLLPANGENGTLKGRISDPSYFGNVRAKTGSMNRISCLSGYLKTKSGIPLVFSIMINNSYFESVGRLMFIEDNICERLIKERF